MSTLAIRQKLVDIAKSQVGIREVPKNSNTGPSVLAYQHSTNLEGTGWPWCAAFVCWCIQQWGKDPDVLAALKLTPAEFNVWRPKTAAAYGFDGWAEKHGLLVIDENDNPGKATLHTGDIVTYDFSHIGIIDTDTNNGTLLLTLEGNTDESGSREGGGVYSKIRSRKLARTIIRILP